MQRTLIWFGGCVFITTALLWTYIHKAPSVFKHSADEYAQAIYLTEGDGYYGISYKRCTTQEECHMMCVNTVVHAMMDHPNKYGFDEFLAKRYCPLNWKVWMKNMDYFLNHIPAGSTACGLKAEGETGG